jgi:MOSC domain-containing protein YiiM
MHVTGLFAGKPQPFGPRKTPSSIIKAPYNKLHLEADGAGEDEQGDKKHHGGSEMALHQFAQKSYRLLQQAFPKIAGNMIVGSMGENLSANDMDDTNVYIGDIYQVGEVVLQVSSPRAPCAKINHRYGQKKIDLFILEQGITGWYYRVLQMGSIKVGDVVELTRRNQQPISVKDLMHMSKPPCSRSFTTEQVKQAQASDGLAPEWQRKLSRILQK